jgi:hypothetical protein
MANLEGHMHAQGKMHALKNIEENSKILPQRDFLH